jgi:hypothetical protein
MCPPSIVKRPITNKGYLEGRFSLPGEIKIGM